MRARLVPALALLCLIGVPTAAFAAPAPEDDKKAKPAIVVQVQSIDELMANFKYLATLAGQEEVAKQFEGLLKSMTGPKGLEGIDTKRPIGLYGSIGPNLTDSTVVLLVPVADNKAVLDLLQRLNVKVEEGKDGVFSASEENIPFPIYFRFANKHAYVTINDAANIAKDKLLDPAKVLTAKATNVLTASLNIDAIPANLKDLAIQEIEQGIANLKEQKDPGETDAQHKLKGQILDEVSKQVIALIKDGGEVSLSLNIDRAKHDLSLEFSLSGKPDSKLAVSIADLGKAKSLFGGLIGKDSALNGLINVALPENVNKLLGPVIDEGIKKALEEEKDKAKREQAAKVFKALEPSLKAGELDVAFDLRGPSDKNLYTLVAGLKLKEGEAVEKLVRDLVKDLPEADRAKIKFDAEKAGSVKIHRIDVQKDLDEQLKQLFGDNPIYVAFRSDAVFVGAGEKGLSALKEALVAQPKAAPPFRLEASVARLVPLFAKDQKAILKAAEEAFKEKDSDKVRLVVEGGKALKLRLDAKAQIVKFIGLAMGANVVNNK